MMYQGLEDREAQVDYDGDIMLPKHSAQSFEDLFRLEDEELMAIIAAHTSNFESFKIPEDVNYADERMDDSDFLGSDLDEIIVEDDTESPTEMDSTEATYIEDVEETTQTGDEEREDNEETVKEEMDATDSAEVTTENITTVDSILTDAEQYLEDIEILKNLAREALKRKIRKVKKPK